MHSPHNLGEIEGRASWNVNVCQGLMSEACHSNTLMSTTQLVSWLKFGSMENKGRYLNDQ